MAIWHVRQDEMKRELFYINRFTGSETSCGVLYPNATPQSIVEWIVGEGDPNPGDVVIFGDGSALELVLERTEGALRWAMRKLADQLLHPEACA